MYILSFKISGFTAIMRPVNMSRKTYSTWIRFKENEIDLNAVIRISDLALPILSKRIKA